jgi:hypothetical protein
LSVRPDLDLGQILVLKYSHGDGTCVDSAPLLRRRHSLPPMASCFVLEEVLLGFSAEDRDSRPVFQGFQSATNPLTEFPVDTGLLKYEELGILSTFSGTDFNDGLHGWWNVSPFA